MIDEPLFYYDLIAMGRACVDEYFLVSRPGHNNLKIPILDRKICGGGQAATSAIIISQLGGKAAYVGNLGQDSYGELIFRELTEFGVNTDAIQRPSQFHTPKALIMVNASNGDRTIYYEKAKRRLPYAIPVEMISKTRSLVLDPDVSLEELEKILRAKSGRSFIVYDGERDRPALEAMTQHADFFIASETLLDMHGTSNRWETFEELRSKVKGELVFTFGEEGSVWVRDSQWIQIPAVPVEKPIDTTGAGDVFHAAFAFFYPREKDVLKALKLASFCAAKSTQRLGNREKTNLVTREELQNLLIQEHVLSQEEFKLLISSRAQ